MMRSRFRTVLLALLSVLALGAVAASAAQAAEGPFFKVGGARLTEGESKEVTGKLSSAEILIDWGSDADITCRTMNFAAGAKIHGSTGANSGSGEGVLELSRCGGSHLGELCNVEALKSTPLMEHLVYLNAERTGHMGLVFAPVKGELIGEFKLSGSDCFRATIKLSGKLAFLVNGGKDEVGKEPAEEKTLSLFLPAAPIKSVWTEKSGSLTNEKIHLETYLGAEVSAVCQFSLELAGGTEWGVFTK